MSEHIFLTGDNFKSEGMLKVTDKHLPTIAQFLDNRSKFVAPHIDTSNWEWYFNYLNLNASYANLTNVGDVGLYKRNATMNDYLLQYGYIPMIFLPQTVDSGLRGKLQAVLDGKGIRYIMQKAISFVNPNYYTEDVDAWVSKLDLAEILGKSPETIRSAEAWRALL